MATEEQLMYKTLSWDTSMIVVSTIEFLVDSNIVALS